ncbi:MAG: hypothetical protein KC657_22560 [Myxococcales bacterium]|nr:hypothetical protein [Myxococcales bacterium]
MSDSDSHHGPAAPPEPKTPMWLPALGAVLFLLVGLAWALSPASPPPTTDAAPAASGAAAGDGGL